MEEQTESHRVDMENLRKSLHEESERNIQRLEESHKREMDALRAWVCGLLTLSGSVPRQTQELMPCSYEKILRGCFGGKPGDSYVVYRTLRLAVCQRV